MKDERLTLSWEGVRGGLLSGVTSEQVMRYPCGHPSRAAGSGRRSLMLGRQYPPAIPWDGHARSTKGRFNLLKGMHYHSRCRFETESFFDALRYAKREVLILYTEAERFCWTLMYLAPGIAGRIAIFPGSGHSHSPSSVAGHTKGARSHEMLTHRGTGACCRPSAVFTDARGGFRGLSRHFLGHPASGAARVTIGGLPPVPVSSLTIPKERTP